MQNQWGQMGEVPATTPASDRMSKELKRRGFGFVGSTICYSLMQACGLVNDHLVTCFRHAEVRTSARLAVAGAIVIVVVLLLFPVFVAIGGLIAAALLGTALNIDAKQRNEDSELLDLNV